MAAERGLVAMEAEAVERAAPAERAATEAAEMVEAVERAA